MGFVARNRASLQNLLKEIKDRITPMSTSSNKRQKKGKDGMGKAGKRKEMVKDWCAASCVWKSKRE